MNFSVGVTDHVKNSWALPCLFKFGFTNKDGCLGH